MPSARFLRQSPRPTSFSLTCQWQPRRPPSTPRSLQIKPRRQQPWHDHAASTLESLLGEHWTVELRRRSIYPAHANKIVRHKKLQKIVSKQRGPRANRAACTIDDFTDGRKIGDWDKDLQQIGLLALSMASPMDARGHYRWLHRWMPQRKGTTTLWSKKHA